jgi:hypothetical protein
VYLTVFALDAASLAVSALVLLRLPPVAPQPRGASGEPALAVLRDRPYAVIAALNTVLQLHIPLITLGIPLWIVLRTHAPGWTVAALLAVAILLLAVGLRSLAEMMRASGSWEISFDLAPPGRHGQYQGFFGSGFTIARTLGPLLITTLIISWGTIGWLLLGMLFLAAGLAMVPAVRAPARGRTRARSSDEAPGRAGQARMRRMIVIGPMASIGVIFTVSPKLGACTARTLSTAMATWCTGR